MVKREPINREQVKHMGDVALHDGHAKTVVGVMQTHATVLQIQVSGALFLRQCSLTTGMEAVIIEAGGIEVLLESVRRHTDWRMEPNAWYTLGLLLTTPTK